jgi:hypothetical protein
MLGIEGGHKRDDFELAIAADAVERQRGVFAPAPE